MKKFMMATGLHIMLFSALHAQDSKGGVIDKALNDPKAEEKAAKADRKILDKTKIFDENTIGVAKPKTQQVARKHSSKKCNGKHK